MGLFEKPPETLIINGKDYRIDTDFRVWIKYQDAISSEKSMEERAGALFKLVKELGLPPSPATMDAMLKFYIGESHENKTGGNKNVAAFDFVKDSEYIFSAFKGAYNIDLTTEKIHWWKFKALFQALPDDCQMCKIMMYRTIDLKDVPKSQRQFYKKMKARYSLGKEKGWFKTKEDMIRHIQELREARKRGK